MESLILYNKHEECANTICKAYFDLFQHGKPTEPQIRIWVKEHIQYLNENKKGRKGYKRGSYQKK